MIVAALSMVGRELPAQSVEVPVSIEISIFLKVLAYDRQLTARAPSQLVIAVAYQGGNRQSAAVGAEALAALRGAEAVDGHAVRAVAIDLDQQSLADGLARTQPTAVYLAPVAEVDVRAMTAAARDAHVTTLTGVPAYVDAGVAVAVRRAGGRPRLIVNLAASRAEGAVFSAELLQLAEVVR